MFDLNTMTVHIFPVTKSEIRAITDERGEPWFVLRDVLESMQSTTKRADAIDAIEHGLGEGMVNDLPLQTKGGLQKTLIVSSPAVTFLVSRSNTETGRKLNRWIHTEVLPSIRKTGAYSMQQTPVIPATYTEALRLALAQAEELERKQAALDYAAPRCREAQPTALPCVHL